MSEVIVERKNRTTIVTLNRPEARNALTRSVVSAVAEAFTDAAADRDVRCVVLSGSGGSFCAGADLRNLLSEGPDVMNHLGEYLDEFHAAIVAIVRCPKPTIASIDGAAVGFGADLALACDLRVASTRAYIQEKFVNIGLMPDGGGTFWLPRLLGTARALKAILLGDKLEAAELEALGLVVSVAPPEDLLSATMALAERIEAGPPLAHQHAKRAVYAGLGDIEAALRREREGQMVLLKSKDALEGMMAWAEKRAPNFRGE